MDRAEFLKKEWIYKDNVTMIANRINEERFEYGRNIRYMERSVIRQVIKSYAEKYDIDIVTASEQVKRIVGKENPNAKLYELKGELDNVEQ